MDTKQPAPSWIQERDVRARFSSSTPGEPPTFVVVEDVVYRRESDQEQARVAMREEELVEAFRADFGQTGFHRLDEILSLANHARDLETDAIRERLLDILKVHRPIIEYAFCPEENSLGGQDWVRHCRCVLPPV